MHMPDDLSNGTTNDQQIRAVIREFILQKLLAGEEAINLTDATPLVSGGIIDSMNALKVGLFLEKSFGIKLAPEQLADPENLETVVAIASLVESEMARQEGARE